MTDAELLNALEDLRTILNEVATGRARIETVNTDYKRRYIEADLELRQRGVIDAIPFPDLWEWHERWSRGDLPSYRSRRAFLADLFDPLLSRLRDRIAGVAPRHEEPTGWPKVDRTLAEMRKRLAEATTEEQFQAVGLLGREALISLAQAVFDPERHPPLDEVTPSESDAKRMLQSYLAVELPGSTNEAARKHARAAFDLAVELQHRRTASFREAALCVEATSSAINVVAIISGRRDPAI